MCPLFFLGNENENIVTISITFIENNMFKEFWYENFNFSSWLEPVLSHCLEVFCIL